MLTRTLPAAALLALPVALAACGGPLLTAELKMASVEVTLPQYRFPSVGTQKYQDVTFDVGASMPVILQKNVDYDLKLTGMTLVLGSGPINNFDTFNRVTITAQPPAGSGLAPLVLVDYVNPHTQTGLTHVTASSSTDADLKPYLYAGKITVRAEYDAGPTTPLGEWTADVTADFFVRVKVDYGAYL